MPVWSSVDDVRARFSAIEISASTRPSEAQVEDWLDEGEATIRAILAAQGIDSSTIVYGSDGQIMIRGYVTDLGAGRFVRARIQIRGDDDDETGLDLIRRFDEFAQQLRENVVQVGGELIGGDVGTSQRHARSHVTDGTQTPDEYGPMIPNRWEP